MKAKLKKKFTTASALNEEQQSNEPIENTSQAELTKMITEISTKVSKTMIESVLEDFLKNKKENIVESEKIKKAEIIKENLVKIENQYYKLTPVTVKKKGK